MATRILRTPPSSAVRTYPWPQFGPVVQDEERQSLAAPASLAARRESCGGGDEAAAGLLEARHRAEVEQVRREAFLSGREEGRREAAAQLESEFARLARAIEEAAGHKIRLRAAAERELVELALAIARRVLRRELQIDPEAVLGLVKAALEKAALREVAEIRLHPAHAAPVRAHLARIGAPAAVHVHEDPSLEPGAVVVETARGAVDASLETQLDEIGRGLADALEAGGRR